MAVDAKILLDTSLQSNNTTLAIHSLLENVKHSQMLQDKFAACEWITASNKLLNSRKDRWKGVCLLGCLVEQCQTELFNENCLSWLRILIQILQQEKQNTNMCKHVAEVLGKILSFSVQLSEISREISLTIIPSLFTAVLNEKNMNLEISLLVVRTCIKFYPGASGSFVKRVESLILQVFNTDNFLLIQMACSCFAVLPNCSNSSGSDKQTSFWEIQWEKVLSTLSAVVKEFYDKNAGSEELHLKTIPVVEPQRTEACVLRFKFLFKCLELMLNNVSKTVNIPLDSTIAIIHSILAVNEKSIENKVGVESILLKSSICAVHLSAIKFLSSLILRCGMNLIFCTKIIPMIVRELSWSTECDEKIHGFQQKYSELRSAMYDCVQYMVHVNSSLGECSDAMKTIIRHIIEDIKPRVTTTKLLAPTTSTSKTTSHGKKAKRKRLQEDVNQLNRTEQKTDYHANRELCLSGLKALNTVILNGGNDVSDILKEVQVFVVTLLLKCQQISTCQSSFPIPYGSPDCRKMLYNLLQTLLYYNVRECPPPLQHAVIIFSQGTQDQDLEVSKFCAEAQMVCQLLIHPRVPVISCRNLLQEQEIVNVPNNEGKQVKVNVDGDKPVGSDSIVEEMRNHFHTTRSPTLNNELSSSTTSLLTKDRNTSDLSKETQVDTSQSVEESGKGNEAIHKIQDQAVTESEDIKRTLPEEFEEEANKKFTKEVVLVGVSSGVSDSTPPEKRRKTEDGHTSYTEENVLNNNERFEESTEMFEQKKLESGQDETLAMEMISSFVDSNPD